jgi:hypothetical protein
MARDSRTIELDCPVTEAYQRWLDYEELDEIVPQLKDVRKTGEDTSHWVAETMGMQVEWEARVTSKEENRRIAWESISGFENRGEVLFEPIDERRTRVTVNVEYQPFDRGPDGRLTEQIDRAAEAVETGLETIGEPSMTRRVTAVFPNRWDAEKAVDWLGSQGVPNDRISLIVRNIEEPAAVGARTGAAVVAEDAGSDVARGAGTGAAVGAGAGALFGLAAAMIPGAGPFIAAGALAQLLGVTGGAMAAGAIVGGTSGALAGALSKWGLDQADAEYYAGEIERGGYFVAADIEGFTLTTEEVESAFRRFNGRTRSY